VQAPAVTTTTSLSASNTNPANGEQITLTATVTANDPAGNDAVGAVVFRDGGVALGAPVPVSGGVAMTTFSSTVAGDHPLTAEFVPTDATVFAGSTSNTVDVTVQPRVAVTTTTTLTASNTNPAVGQQSTLTATVHANVPATNDALGVVVFRDGGVALGAPVPVSGGTATRQFSSTVAGAHMLTAEFVPTDANAFTGSTGNLTVNVQAAPLAITTKRLPGAHDSKPYSVTLTATGGVAPYTWAVTAGSLPPGITLNATTGVISGNATQTGKFSLTVTVTDQVGASASKNLTLSVAKK